MFGVLIALLLAVAVAALLQMRTMRAVTVGITERWLPGVELVNKMNAGASDFRMQEYQYVQNTGDRAMALMDKLMGSTLAQFEKDRQA